MSTTRSAATSAASAHPHDRPAWPRRTDRTGRADSTDRTGRTRRTRRTRALAVLGAAAASLAMWAIASPLAGIDLRVHVGSRTEHVGPVTVVIASMLAGLAAWALLAVLERFTPRARAAWTANTLVALALSLAGPLSSGATTAAKLALASMHVATAVVLVAALPGRKAFR